MERDDGGVDWLHYSQKDNTVILRSIQASDVRVPVWIETAYRLPGDQEQLTDALRGARDFSLSEIAARTADAIDVSADRLSLDDVEAWDRVFARLREPGVLDGPLPVERSTQLLKTTTAPDRSRIPQTRLRRFYETLRDLSTAELQEKIAEYFVENGTERSAKLQVFFRESVAHFGRYNNTRDCFHPPRPSSWCDAYREDQAAFAHCLVARMTDATENAWYSLGSKLRSDLQVVDYEISPLRTTGGASFEDGKIGTSGGGGLDLLLRDREDAIWIAEVKAPGDSNLFLALIQALTYAVELTTVSQAERLRRCYPDKLSGLQFDQQNGCTCSILLVHERDDKPKLLKQAKTLARQLMRETAEETASPVALKVRQIAIASASLQNGGVQLECEFSTDDSADAE